jgi:small subunit ribosomal protein S1
VTKTIKDAKTMEELLAENEEKVKPLAENDTIEGTVVSVTKAGIWLDLGVYGTGLAVGYEAAEAGYNDSVPGDKITASVIMPEMDEGYALLSLRKASKEKSWDVLFALKDSAEIIKVKPFDANKGGLLIEYDGVKGFLPVSQLSTEHYPRVSDKDEILNRLMNLTTITLDVIVLDVDKKEGKLIFSEKEARKDELSSAIGKLDVGQKVKGKVTGVVDFGIFMNIDGIEGLVHISEISWDRVEDPSKFAKIGDDLDVVVIGKEHDKVSLSLKRLLDDPWAKEVSHIKVGDEIEGEVTRITPFGAFVRITKSVEALVHISELSEEHIANPSEVVKVGENYTFKVISVDIDNHKLALSLKEMAKKKTEKTVKKVAETKADKKPVKKIIKKADKVKDKPAKPKK